jgi:hypothetical protein
MLIMCTVGVFEGWNGSHDLKSLLMRFVCFILLSFGTSTKDPIQSLDWFYLLFLLLPPVFSRLDVFSWFFLRLDAKNPFQDQSVFRLLDWILRYTLFHGFDTLGSPLKRRRVPWPRRRIFPLASPNELCNDNQTSTMYFMKVCIFVLSRQIFGFNARLGALLINNNLIILNITISPY